MQVYLDANIYLEYFRENSKERLAPLRELVKLVKGKKVGLLIPSQTRHEYYRNRRKIAELTRTALVKQAHSNFSVPATLDTDTREVKSVLEHVASLGQAYKKLIEKYDRAVDQEKTDADLLIRELFKLGEGFDETEIITHRAYVRYMKGNPPRKTDHSYGDAITWETLLENGTKDDLLMVSKDGDFIENSKGQPALNHFLYVEWRIKSKKKKKADLFTSLAECVNHINKKKTFKKEIVEKEKRARTFSEGIVNAHIYPNIITDNPFLKYGELLNNNQGIMNMPVGGLSSVSIDDYLRPRIDVNASPANSIALSMSYTIEPAKFCPFCGSRAEGYGLNGYRCTSERCRKEFNI